MDYSRKFSTHSLPGAMLMTLSSYTRTSNCAPGPGAKCAIHDCCGLRYYFCERKRERNPRICVFGSFDFFIEQSNGRIFYLLSTGVDLHAIGNLRD